MMNKDPTKPITYTGYQLGSIMYKIVYNTRIYASKISSSVVNIFCFESETNSLA